MKILLVNRFLYRKGGSETVFFKSADLLRAAGHEVVLFGRAAPQNIDYPAPTYTCKTLYGPIGQIREGLSYFYNKDAAKCIDEVLTRERPDLVHIHLFWGGLTPSILRVIHQHAVPVIHTAHDYRMVCPAYTFRNGKGEVCEQCRGGHFIKCFTNLCSKRNPLLSLMMASEMTIRNLHCHPATALDAIIYVSRFCRDKHEEIDPAFKRTRSMVLYNCTDLAGRYPDYPADGGYYLYYGRLSFEKGIGTLVEAFNSLPGLHLKIVGTGPSESELKQKCKSADVEFLGYRTGEELYDLVRHARFVCVPSEWYENNPMTIVESYSLGVPVIGAKIGGIPEIVEEGKTGLLFESGNVDRLRDCISSSLALEEEDYQQMRRNARRFADLKFNPDKYISDLLDFYQTVIDANK